MVAPALESWTGLGPQIHLFPRQNLFENGGRKIAAGVMSVAQKYPGRKKIEAEKENGLWMPPAAVVVSHTRETCMHALHAGDIS